MSASIGNELKVITSRRSICFWFCSAYTRAHSLAGRWTDIFYKEHFENEVLRKRPYIKKEWCIQVCENPLKVEPQENNRFRFWGKIEELESRILRVVTLTDKKTIHNAFPDRRFKL